MRTILYQTGTSLSGYMNTVCFKFNSDIEDTGNTIKVNIESRISNILRDSTSEKSDNEQNNLSGSRLPPLEDIPYSKNIRCPKDLNIIIPKERRNKKRILNNDRDITPFSKYYQN